MTDLQQIKDKLDLVTYIEDAGIPLKKTGRYHKACCPFHSEKTPSFMVDAERQTWRCYGACATGGDLFDFAMRHSGREFADVLEDLAGKAGVELTRRETAESKQHERLYGLLKEAAEWYQQQLITPAAADVRQYLTRRGMNRPVVEPWQIGYAPADSGALLSHLRTLGYTDAELIAAGLLGKRDDGKLFTYFRHRLMFPLKDKRGRVVGFAGRQLREQDNPKYLNSPQSAIFSKSRLLYGYDLAAPHIRQHGKVVIVEGYTDVIAAHHAGYQNVVAQMGTALTEQHLELLRIANTVYLALDGDAAGQQAAQRSVNMLAKLSADVRVMTLLKGADPDEVVRAGNWQTVLDSAEPLADYLIRTRIPDISPNSSPALRTKAARDLLPVLTATDDALLKRLNVERLAQHIGVTPAMLQNEPPRPNLRVLPKPAPVRDNLEAYLLRAFVENESYYIQACTMLRELDMDIITPHDFTNYRREMQAFYDSSQQIELDTAAFMTSVLGEWVMPADNVPLDAKSVLHAARRLRLQRLLREVDELVELGDVDGARQRIRQKAQILAAGRKH